MCHSFPLLGTQCSEKPAAAPQRELRRCRDIVVASFARVRCFPHFFVWWRCFERFVLPGSNLESPLSQRLSDKCFSYRFCLHILLFPQLFCTNCGLCFLQFRQYLHQRCPSSISCDIRFFMNPVFSTVNLLESILSDCSCCSHSYSFLSDSGMPRISSAPAPFSPVCLQSLTSPPRPPAPRTHSLALAPWPFCQWSVPSSRSARSLCPPSHHRGPPPPVPQGPCPAAPARRRRSPLLYR